MSDIVKVLRGKHALDYDEKTLDQFCNEAADEIEKLRAENENLRKTIRDGIKLIDLDAVKSFRKTLKWALGEKE